MMTDDRYIADARERLRKKAQNEATCIALNDMLKDAQDEVRRLREENERLRKDAAVGAAIQRAAAELPVGDMIEITVDKGSATVVIYYDDGDWETMDIDGDNRLASEINAAIDATLGAK